MSEPVPDIGSTGKETLRMELLHSLWDVQHILLGDASQSSSSAKLFESWDY